MQVEGRIDHSTAPAFGSVLLPHVEGCVGDDKKLLVDLSKVNYMSSAGLRVLMIAAKGCRKQEGKVVLAGLQPSVREVFKIGRFDMVLRYLSDRARCARGDLAGRRGDLYRPLIGMQSLAISKRTEALTIDAVAQCTEFAGAQARQAGFAAARVDEVELVVEEVVANICHYSYGDRLGNVELVCRLIDGPMLGVRIR